MISVEETQSYDLHRQGHRFKQFELSAFIWVGVSLTRVCLLWLEVKNVKMDCRLACDNTHHYHSKFLLLEGASEYWRHGTIHKFTVETMHR